MTKLTSRRWANFVMLTTATAAGLAVGYAAWLGVAFETTLRSLRVDARQRSDASERYPAEGRALLREMNALPDAPCSEADIANFRRLLMKANYVKDAGRMRGPHLACSAILRTSDLPATEYEPTFQESDGVLIYTQIKALNMGRLTPIVLRQGDSYVALDPHDRNQAPRGAWFAMTMRNAPVGSNRLGGIVTTLSTDALTRDGSGWSGGNFYATACSPRNPPCLTALIPIRWVLIQHHQQLKFWMIAGGAVGCWFGFIGVAFIRLRRGLEHQLQRAIRRDLLYVVYQPLVDIKTRALIGAEALVRWTDLDKVAIAPDIFIKVAEQRGFVNKITQLVVRHVLQDLARFLETNPEFHVNVNVAASDLTDPNFLPMLEDHLRNAHVLPRSLGIEITEGATARCDEAIRTIEQLRRRGHKVYIDNFGTGYSSLAYLKDLSVDGIKIDRAFTRTIGTDSVTAGILPQILAMADLLNLSVVAEGVETEAQSAYYENLSGPMTGQGWLFGFPVPADKFREQWLTDATETAPSTVEMEPSRRFWRLDATKWRASLHGPEPEEQPQAAGVAASE